jgi:hypothetical protein
VQVRGGVVGAENPTAFDVFEACADVLQVVRVRDKNGKVRCAIHDGNPTTLEPTGQRHAVTWLALGLALQATSAFAAPPPALPPPIRLVATARLHVGIRPAALASPLERAVGLTVQVSR